jgi:hypothetical protein
MLKILFIASFVLTIVIGCNNEIVTAPFNYERDTPVWLKAKIDSMSNNKDYFGTKVFRHEWKSNFIFYIYIPINSCAYCEVYDPNGNKIHFTDDAMFQDYIDNRKNEILVWEWKK